MESQKKSGALRSGQISEADLTEASRRLLAALRAGALEDLESTRPIDLLITDIVMPDRVNGVALSRRARMKRLSNEFSIESTPGKGTTVTLARWKL